MTIATWERRLVALVDEFWVENKGSIGKYQATLHDGTKVTIAFPARKPKPQAAPAPAAKAEPVCLFDLAFRGPCGKPTEAGKFCEEHAAKKCISCGEPATRECSTAYQFVCGFPLCDNCVDNGRGGHVRRAAKGDE